MVSGREVEEALGTTALTLYKRENKITEAQTVTEELLTETSAIVRRHTDYTYLNQTDPCFNYHKILHRF